MNDNGEANGSPAIGENEDLSEIVLRLRKRKNDRYNYALVNHPVTRAFLDGGMALVKHEFSEGAPASEVLPSFGTVRRKDIVARAGTYHAGATEGAFRSRWEFLAHFFDDLVRYALRSAHWSPHFLLVDEFKEKMTAPGGDLSKLAQALAFRDLTMIADNPPAMRFQYVIAAFSARDRGAGTALMAVHRDIIEQWQKLYQSILDSRGLKLRPGITIGDVTTILHAAMEGLSMRLLTDEDSTILDRENNQSLLGKLALAMIAACIDDGDGQTLAERVQELAPPDKP